MLYLRLDNIYMVYNMDLKSLLRYEVIERSEEGYDIDINYFNDKIDDALDKSDLMKIYDEICKLSFRRDYPYREPNNLSEISSLSQKYFEVYEKISEEAFRDKMLGGFLGRCAGCMLGKPVEGWSHREIINRLIKIGEYPLRNYFPEKFFTEEEIKDRIGLTRNTIKYVERDDDIDYTLLNLHIFYKYGSGFKTSDIGKEWLLNLPYYKTYTAERMAYRNLVNGLSPPDTAIYLNPFREWIGAQIRADTWGYVCPGNPRLASEYAYRDAVLSHTKNGVYGEMMVSAMISTAFIENDVEKIVLSGLSYIPKTSRLGNAIRDILEKYRRKEEYFTVISSLLGKYRYHPVHTINNAIIVVSSILWSEGDFSKAICLAVMSGLDTDCNGATVGSIIGVLNGYNMIKEREKWFKPLNNMIKSSLAEFNRIKISDIIDIYLKLYKRHFKTF